MCVVGGCPWHIATESDKDFTQVMEMDGNISELLRKYNRTEYVTTDLVQLFQCFFQYEEKRWNLSKISKNMKWLRE